MTYTLTKEYERKLKLTNKVSNEKTNIYDIYHGGI